MLCSHGPVLPEIIRASPRHERTPASTCAGPRRSAGEYTVLHIADDALVAVETHGTGLGLTESAQPAPPLSPAHVHRADRQRRREPTPSLQSAGTLLPSMIPPTAPSTRFRAAYPSFTFRSPTETNRSHVPSVARGSAPAHGPAQSHLHSHPEGTPVNFKRIGSIAAIAIAGAFVLSSCAANEGGAAAPRRPRLRGRPLQASPAPSTASARRRRQSAQNAWVAGFQTGDPDVTINYDPQGSGAGRKSFISGAADFAGSDAA